MRIKGHVQLSNTTLHLLNILVDFSFVMIGQLQSFTVWKILCGSTIISGLDHVKEKAIDQLRDRALYHQCSPSAISFALDRCVLLNFLDWLSIRRYQGDSAPDG